MLARSILISMLATIALPYAAHAQDVPPALSAEWLAEDIEGRGVIDDLQTTLEIRTDGSFGGHAGCNSYRGQMASGEGDKLSFGPAAATRMMCPPALMDQERKLLDALPKVASWAIENGILTLSDTAGKPVLRFAKIRDTTDVTITLPGIVTVARETNTYACADGRQVEAEYINAGPISLVSLTIDKEPVLAATITSASGARYAGGRWEWWTKGEEATLRDVTAGEGDGVACKAG